MRLLRPVSWAVSRLRAHPGIQRDRRSARHTNGTGGNIGQIDYFDREIEIQNAPMDRPAGWRTPSLIIESVISTIEIFDLSWPTPSIS
jgi:hypothetical protein